MNTEVLRAWSEDDMPRAISVCDQIAQEFPRDLAIVKLQQYFEFNLGNSPGMLRAVRAGSTRVDLAHRASGVLGDAAWLPNVKWWPT